ncbi:MAG: hypothetical protein K2X91_13945 [Thermoleophilia bacterium]|nr:hypothetical protein [Thermoleophilia bacterium]
MATATPELVTQELTYCGRRTSAAGKTVWEYQPAGDAPAAWYRSALVPSAAVGSIVTVTRPADRPESVYTKGEHAPRITGFADVDEATLLGWQVADRSAYERKAQEDRYRRAAKAAGGLEEHLLALEAAARNLSSVDRAAFGRYVGDRVRGIK